jgi:hypothetical protein
MFEIIVFKSVIQKKFKKNGAHLVKKGHLKKIRIIHSQGLNA